MDADLMEKFSEILEGKLKYTSPNLAVNMLVTKLQKKIVDDPSCKNACMMELDAFAEKYPNIIKFDYKKIRAL